MENQKVTMPFAYLSRKETFSAAHRLCNPSMSDEENLRKFDKCLNVHGHNYKVKVTVCGMIDAKTGMVINLTGLKEHIAKVLGPLDHKNLDVDVPYFKNKCSTVENIAVYIWDGIAALLPEGSLFEVKVNETDKNAVLYRGERRVLLSWKFCLFEDNRRIFRGELTLFSGVQYQSFMDGYWFFEESSKKKSWLRGTDFS